MPVIKPNEAIVPFLGDRLSFIRGLDPLGLQNTSEATYTLLLPGLSNVTGRIRYYSFYCWLLDEYANQVGNTDPRMQRKFIRKAEYIIALVSQLLEGDHTSIPGSDYATDDMQRNADGVFDLESATYKPDGSTRETYWNYSGGAFGQYYVGALQAINIVSERENNSGIFVRTTSNPNNDFVSGEAIAKAFDSNVQPLDKRLFLASIAKGSITQKNLRQLLNSFDLTRVPEETEEQRLLIALLHQKDLPLLIEEDPMTFRKSTINHMLKFIEVNDTEITDIRAFVDHCYDIKEVEDQSLKGWYYYQLNEYWHYSNTAIFNGVLDYLHTQAGPQFMPLPALIDEVCEKTLTVLKDEKWIRSGNSTIEETINKLSLASEYELFNRIDFSSPENNIAYSLLLIFKLYRTNKLQLPELKEYAKVHQIERDGDSVSYFLKFDASLKLSVNNFLLDYLYSRIIYRHQLVALKKIGGGVSSTQKFILEDQHIRFIMNFDPGFTGPRLGRLFGFLRDLNVISEQGNLTKHGLSLMQMK
jgi:hypothetical protein